MQTNKQRCFPRRVSTDAYFFFWWHGVTSVQVNSGMLLFCPFRWDSVFCTPINPFSMVLWECTIYGICHWYAERIASINLSREIMYNILYILFSLLIQEYGVIDFQESASGGTLFTCGVQESRLGRGGDNKVLLPAVEVIVVSWKILPPGVFTSFTLFWGHVFMFSTRVSSTNEESCAPILWLEWKWFPFCQMRRTCDSLAVNELPF